MPAAHARPAVIKRNKGVDTARFEQIDNQKFMIGAGAQREPLRARDGCGSCCF
jgi:hypothetical protein